MSQYLTFAELDTAIQNKMGETSPDEPKRLEAINTTALDIYAEFDIKPAKREKTISIIPDGTAYVISAVGGINIQDFKGVSDLRYTDNDLNTEEFSFVDDDLFNTHIAQGQSLNEYTIDYADGQEFLKVNTVLGETVATSFKLIYYTAYTSTTSAGVFQKDITNVASDLLLIPRRFKSLVVVRCLQYLSPIALGVDAEIPLRRLDKQEQIELQKLRIDIGAKPKQSSRKVKIHSPY